MCRCLAASPILLAAWFKDRLAVPLTMQIAQPPPIEKSLSEKKAALHLAVGMYSADEAPLGHAAGVGRLLV